MADLPIADASSQQAVFDFLADPRNHGIADRVVRIDTHGAAVFLAGPDAYKVKKTVRFPFLDYSTLAKRKHACEAEIAVNRLHAPDLYLGAVPIVRTSAGFAIGGSGEPAEWLVHMRRFDERRTLDLVAPNEPLSAELLRDIAEAVHAWHDRAERRDGARATRHLEGVVAETLAELAAAPEIFGAEAAARYARELRDRFARHRPLLLARGAAGKVRRCHGDLHLRNIALIGGRPVLFDAIEFDEALATTDILYDIAFLLMDLWERGQRQAANACMNRYLWAAADIDAELAGLALLPMLMSLRAAIRAKVAVLPAADGRRPPGGERAALPYFRLSESLLRNGTATLVALGGLSGSGKTSLAAEIAADIGRPPGAVHLRSDIERKRMLGVPELEKLPAAAYGAEMTERCYENLRRQAALALAAGQDVILDAVHATPAERDAVSLVAGKAGARFVGFWLDAPVETLLRRIEARRADASDADADVLRRQLDYRLGPIDWQRLDADRTLADMRDAALRRLQGPDPIDAPRRS